VLPALWCWRFRVRLSDVSAMRKEADCKASAHAGLTAGAALEGGCAAGATADGFAQVERCIVGLASAAEGDMQLGASTVERMHMMLGAWQCPALLPSQ